MTLEMLATVFALLILLKLVTVFVKPKITLNLSSVILKNDIITTLVYLLIAVIIGFNVFSQLTVVQVASVMLFTVVLVGIALLPYSKEFVSIVRRTMEKKYFIKRNLLSIIIWLTLALWILWNIYG